MSAADRNKIIIAAGVALVAIVLIFVFVRGRRPAQPPAQAGAFGTPMAAPVEGPAAPGAPGPPTPGIDVAAAPGAPGEAAPGAVVRAGPVIQMGTGPSVITRPDPTITFDPPITTPEELLVNPPPVALVPGGLRVQTDRPAQIGDRRVAGLLFNDRAWAILEKDGQTFIVKPGDVVDGIRITAIAQNSIYLVDRDGNRWEVPLRGPTPGAASSGVGPAAPGMPGWPPTG